MQVENHLRGSEGGGEVHARACFPFSRTLLLFFLFSFLLLYRFIFTYIYICVFLYFFIFWQYSSGSTPLTGMEAGLLTTTTSSSMCITVIGSEVTGTSCLQHTNRNQLNVAFVPLATVHSISFSHPRIHRDKLRSSVCRPSLGLERVVFFLGGGGGTVSG